MVLLKANGLTKDFGNLRVVDHVDLEVKEGCLYSIVGPNGAGKTTFFNLISGFLKPTEGRVEFKEKDITFLSSHQIARLGIHRSFQIITLFSDLTVLENVRLPLQAQSKYRFSLFKKVSSLKGTIERSHEILNLLGLSGKGENKACELSHGEQRLIDIGIAMAGDCSLLLLDEPTSGLSPAESTEIAKVIRKLAESITVILIEHRVQMVTSISDRIMVLDHGQVVADGTPEQIRKNENVYRAYTGQVDAKT